MSNPNPALNPITSTPRIDEDATFAALNNAIRRNILVRLAMKGPKIGAELTDAAKGIAKSIRDFQLYNATLKHLKVMVEAGIVVQQDNPKDGRRTLYRVSPEIKVTTQCDEIHFDLDFCVVRLPQD